MSGGRLAADPALALSRHVPQDHARDLAWPASLHTPAPAQSSRCPCFIQRRPREIHDGQSVTFTARKGTIIFCNTSGFHRGGFATRKPHVFATLSWESPASLKALSERNYDFVPTGDEDLSTAQRYR